MRLTDTHCHLGDTAFTHCLPHIIAAAETVGVCRFIVPSTQRCDFNRVAMLANVPSVHIALGIHPWFCQSSANNDFTELEHLLKQHPQAWVGEIGLDFCNKNLVKTQQIEVFSYQLQLAQHLHRPVIIHNCKATAEVLKAVKHNGFTQGGIVHAFSGSMEEARMLITYGFKIGIGSLLLNPQARKVREAAVKLPLGDIVLETDSPFMLKNAVNTPANVLAIAKITAQLRGITPAEVAVQTEYNVDKLLGRTGTH